MLKIFKILIKPFLTFINSRLKSIILKCLTIWIAKLKTYIPAEQPHLQGPLLLGTPTGERGEGGRREKRK